MSYFGLMLMKFFPIESLLSDLLRLTAVITFEISESKLFSLKSRPDKHLISGKQVSITDAPNDLSSFELKLR